MAERKTKVTLFWPVTKLSCRYDLPLGVAYISKVLLNEGFEVVIIDSHIISKGEEDVDKFTALKKSLREVEKTNPDIVGVGAWAHNNAFAYTFIRSFKKRNPHIPILLGGYDATYMPTETLNLFTDIDYLVRGEGEITTLELCKVLSVEGLEEKDLTKIKGISYYSAEKKSVVHTPDRPPIQNLDSLPLYDYEEFKHLKKKDVLRASTVNLGRGCSGTCSFCSLRGIWPKKRFFSIKYLDKQFKHLTDLYQLDFSFLIDDNLATDSVYAMKFVKFKQEKYNFLTFGGFARVDMVTRELFREAGKTNINNIGLGIESILPKTLRFLNKTSKPLRYISKIPKALKILEESNIKVNGNFITGTPFETEKDLKKMEDYLLNLVEKKVDIMHFALNITPGNLLWRRYQEGDLKLNYFKQGRELRWFDSEYTAYPWINTYNWDVHRYHITPSYYAKFIKNLDTRLNDRLNDLNVENRLFKFSKEDEVLY